MKNILVNLRALGPYKLAALGGVFVLMAVLMTLIATRGNRPDALLYSDLDPKEAAEMTSVLTQRHIPYRLSGDGETIFLNRENIAEARLMLAQSGLPSSGGIGYELFDRKNGLATSAFEENIDQTRALEGELERSLILIQGVKSARVHLVLRHRELFSANEQASQASIILNLKPGQQLDHENIRAISNLVLAAVPGLQSDHISIIDNRGHVLEDGNKERISDENTDPEAVTLAAEHHLAQSVEGLLATSLGQDHVHIETNITFSFDKIHQTRETFDPDQQVLRSQKTESRKSFSAEEKKNVSVQNNLPNADAAQPKTGTQSIQQEETNNYEIGKTTQVLVQDKPKIIRQTIAVLVDYKTERSADGHKVQIPRDSAELAKIDKLVKGAVGYDQSRGDIVTVTSMMFDNYNNTENPTSEKYKKISSIITSESFLSFGMLILSAAFVGIVILKPIIKNSNNINNSLSDDKKLKLMSGIKELENSQPNNLLQDKSSELSDTSSKALVPLIENTSISKFEEMDGKRHEKLSSLNQIAAIVDSQHAASVAILRHWISKSDGD
ncbi:flagellar basal-body MS-ring/collar protein FliF [Acidomonas methanolica]|nr:flagellar basal-body MS-ring/collar protein FliF [Acidomonas methanolica]MBU2655678.1 flagellar M-ring protein FliF [Acidomonas methanolica]